MMDRLSNFSFQPMLNDRYNKGRGVCYPVCGMVHVKNPLLLIGSRSCVVVSADFLSKLSFILCSERDVAP